MIYAVLRDDPIVEIGMYKMICLHPDLKDLRQDSVVWLQSRGYHDPLESMREWVKKGRFSHSIKRWSYHFFAFLSEQIG